MATPEDIRHWRSLLEEATDGWDFSGHTDVEQDTEPWDYAQIARHHLQVSHRALDLGTGGGELLASFGEDLPETVAATEGWAPNLPVATERLEPLGIEVHEHDSEAGQPLPFPDDAFDLVLARHEAYDPREVARVLAPDGVLVTQQVSGEDLADITAALGGTAPYPEVSLIEFERALVRAGMTVERADTFTGEYRFADLDALLRLLARLPWMLPEGFDASRDAERLDALRRRARDGALTGVLSRFLLVARAPAATDHGRLDHALLRDDAAPEVPRV